jgi:hypothetical protein
MDEELQRLEHKLLLTNKEYKIPKSQLFKWIKFAVVQEFRQECHGREQRKKNRNKALTTHV